MPNEHEQHKHPTTTTVQGARRRQTEQRPEAAAASLEGVRVRQLDCASVGIAPIAAAFRMDESDRDMELVSRSAPEERNR